jgi:thiol-disulfide isomerase/thioredoxin
MNRLAVLFLVLSSAGCLGEPHSEASPWEDDWLIATYHADLAIQAALLPAPETPDENPDGVCSTCGGDGVLGDGRIEIQCPDCRQNQTRQIETGTGSERKATPRDGNARIPRLLIFSASWCPPCAKLEQSIAELPEAWTRSSTPETVIQWVDVSTTEKNLQAKDFFGVEFDSVPAVFAYWSKEKHEHLTGSANSALAITKWFNQIVADKRARKKFAQPLVQQFLAELHRVTDTELPRGAIDVDVSDRATAAPAILEAMSAGQYSPSPGVTLESSSGLFPTRTTRQPNGTVRLHFDQRPKLTARKWMLRVVARIQWVDISADGHSILVSLSGFPDIRLKL